MSGADPSSATTVASRQRRLDRACRVADALLAAPAPDAGAAQAEVARRRREALELVEQSRLAVAVFDVATRAPQLVNAAWRTLFRSRDAYAAIPGIDEVARTGATVHIAELALGLDGRPGYGAATLRATRDGPIATGVIVACADITDEVIARKLAVGADALAWGGPVAGEPDYFNRRWLAYAADAPGWSHALHPDDAARCTGALAWVVRQRGSTELEARLRRADGEYRWHRVRLAIASPEPRWFGTAIDIHDARRASAERTDLVALASAARADAEEAHRLKDRFLDVVSHELRTPVTAMMLWEGILRNDATDAALRSQALAAIRHSVLAQSRMVGDLLDISRAIAGKLRIDVGAVDLDRVVTAALAAIAPAAAAGQVALERRGAPVGGEIRGDAVRLRQVLDSVLANAVKLTDPGGRVTLTTARRDRSIVIEVEDTGRGIAADLLPRLFDPFGRVDRASARGAADLGFELAVAKQLVEAHRGTLVAASRGQGLGATLTISLPAAPAAAAADRAMAARKPDLTRNRVLVIDDDQRVREALGLLLARAGAVVDTAGSAEAARARIAQRAPEALVCDIAMPGEDGYSFIRWLRASGRDIAAIALTAHGTEADVGRSLAAGFDRHLAKPIDFDQLVASIDELIAARRAAVPAP